MNPTLAEDSNVRFGECPRCPRDKTRRLPVLVSVLFLALTTPDVCLQAGPGTGSGDSGAGTGIAQSELMRRQALVYEAASMIEEAGKAEAAGDWQRARQLYEGAWRALPDAPATAAWRVYAVEGFANSSVELAKQLAAAGELDMARGTLDEVLAHGVHPKHAASRTLRAQLDDPERFNPAVTPEHLDNVARVNELLRMARGYEELADWDKAEATLMDVLRIDPHNTAAVRQMTSIQQQLRRYNDSARDHTRESMLADVDRQWQTAVPASTDIGGLFGVGGSQTTTTHQLESMALASKMQGIIIPQVELVQVTVREALDYLSAQALNLDPDPDTARRGLSFIVSPSVPNERVINLTLRQAPLEEVLRYITTQSGTMFKIEPFGVRIDLAGEGAETIVTRAFRVPPNFIQTQPMQDNVGVIDPFGDAQGAAGNRGLSTKRMSAQDFLGQQGIHFPEGTSAHFNPSNSTLVVRQTQENLEMIEFLVDQAIGISPRQVEIRMTMVQIRANKLNELGMNWLLGPFDLGGGNFGSGGTSGSIPVDQVLGSFPFARSPGAVPVGANPVTAGLRSIGGLAAGPSLDSFLSNNTGGDPNLQAGLARQAPATRSPTVLTLGGVLTSPQYQAALHALRQSGNADLAVAPAVVTRSGQRALVEIIREFPYPAEFEPPEVPQNVSSIGGGGGSGLVSGPLVTMPFLPGGPSSFDVRRVGVILDVESIISEDNTTVELSLSPEIVLFEGFIDYGGPVTIGYGGIGNQRVLAAQPFLQPIFRTNRLNTAVTVYDGATVVIGGAITQDLRSIHDRVPIFGDVPLAGRLFQSDLNQTTTLNVVFFVQVRIIDPGGQPVNR